ncbi:hypothetical protein EDC02_4576 [Micromonospora sp. Llam0]|nr:hypothetical protein EDC02_4576 [Micromonospora sp. Llam0]
MTTTIPDSGAKLLVTVPPKVPKVLAPTAASTPYRHDAGL